MPRDDDDTLLALIEDIHAAALDPCLWTEVLARIGEAVSATAGTIFVHDFADSSLVLDGPGFAVFTGIEPGALEAYAAHYSMTNVWTAHEEKLPAGTAVLSSNLYPDSMLKKTEFYGDWLRRQDLFYALGSVVEKEETRAVKLSFLRPEGAGPFGERELRLMRRMMPHLRTAVSVHRRVHRLTQLSYSALATLDLLNHGVIFVTANGRLLHWNAAARRICGSTGTLAVAGNGELRARTHDLSLKLADAIRRACTPVTAGMDAPGSLLALPAEGGNAQVFVAPAGAAQASPYPAGAAAVLFVTDVAGPMKLAETLRSVYGCSPAEAALGEALVNGKPLKAFAEERCVSLNTVKTQLKGLSAKVGAKRQVDVVRAILTGPVMFRNA
jgi:DNA-binding CsgD family transcriptional regulator